MPNLTFTTAVRKWSQDRYAVEFPGQWEATRYRFFIAGEVLEELGDLEPAIDAETALPVFDDQLGTLLPAADFVWSRSDKLQDEYVITSELLQEFRRDNHSPDERDSPAEDGKQAF